MLLTEVERQFDAEESFNVMENGVIIIRNGHVRLNRRNLDITIDNCSRKSQIENTGSVKITYPDGSDEIVSHDRHLLGKITKESRSESPDYVIITVCEERDGNEYYHAEVYAGNLQANRVFIGKYENFVKIRPVTNEEKAKIEKEQETRREINSLTQDHINHLSSIQDLLSWSETEKDAVRLKQITKFRDEAIAFIAVSAVEVRIKNHGQEFIDLFEAEQDNSFDFWGISAGDGNKLQRQNPEFHRQIIEATHAAIEKTKEDSLREIAANDELTKRKKFRPELAILEIVNPHQISQTPKTDKRRTTITMPRIIIGQNGHTNKIETPDPNIDLAEKLVFLTQELIPVSGKLDLNSLRELQTHFQAHCELRSANIKLVQLRAQIRDFGRHAKVFVDRDPNQEDLNKLTSTTLQVSLLQIAIKAATSPEGKEKESLLTLIKDIAELPKLENALELAKIQYYSLLSLNVNARKKYFT